jgi:hypothetical protein
MIQSLWRTKKKKKETDREVISGFEGVDDEQAADEKAAAAAEYSKTGIFRFARGAVVSILFISVPLAAIFWTCFVTVNHVIMGNNITDGRLRTTTGLYICEFFIAIFFTVFFSVANTDFRTNVTSRPWVPKRWVKCCDDLQHNEDLGHIYP